MIHSRVQCAAIITRPVVSDVHPVVGIAGPKVRVHIRIASKDLPWSPSIKWATLIAALVAVANLLEP